MITIAKEFGLCEALLGVENTSSECFGYRLGKCKGACKGLEKPLFYNLRFITAVSRIRLLPWPFNGPIRIEEYNELLGIREYFFIDKWCYIGKVRVETQSNNQSETMIKDVQFDVDIYKILKRFLQNERNLKNVKTIRQEEMQNFFSLQTA